MKKYFFKPSTFLNLLFFCSTVTFSQTPGLIVRPAGGTGPSVLNPNQDVYTSATSAGFTTSDITQSEILYKVIPPLTPEPTGDLATGPNGGFTDIVKFVDGSGCYIFNNGTSLLFRLRIGGIVNGAKAYNILFDTDYKLGATGSYADPNYVAPTNNGNGNPGFEIEIAFETGVGVVIYNVDGIVNPSVANTYPLSTNTLISVALSRESNDADFFYDFFVPLSALNSLGLSNSTPFRIVTTTNTNPGSAFQGTRSDIYGINDVNFPSTTDAWQYVGENTPTITLNDLTSGGSGFSGVCTAAPSVNTGIGAGSNISITGTWTRLDAAKPSTATIYIYKNGVLAGSTTCTTGSSWTYTIASIINGDVITAKAQASGESMCLLSNSVAVTTCTPANNSSTSSAAFGTCVNNQRGMAGTRVTNAVIKIYQLLGGSATSLYATDGTPGSPSTYLITYSTSTAWEYNGANNGGQIDPCSGGANDIPPGSYYITVTESGKCESAPIWGSCVGSSITTTATPVITQTLIYPNTTAISGTAVAGATVRMYINGYLHAETTATGGAYSFSNLVLQTGDIVTVRAQFTAQCSSAAATLTVNCFTSAPTITTDVQGYLASAATTVSGISSEPAGTTIRLYQSLSTLLGTTTVQANGTWSLTVAALTGAASFYATAQNGTCTLSANSASATTRSATIVCPTITGTPYVEGATTVSGTFASSFTGTVYLYQDGGQIGSAGIVASSVWSIIISSPYSLYAGGILTVGAQTTGSTLNRSCGSTTTVTCSVPSTPSVSPTSSTITTGQTVAYTVTNTQSGVLYSVQDATSGFSYSTSQFGNGGSEIFTTAPFTTQGTYSLNITADKLSGNACKASASASVTVSAVLSLTWQSFTAQELDKAVLLKWSTANELNTKDFLVQNSNNVTNWNDIGVVVADNNNNRENSYSFLHNLPFKGNNYYRLLQRDKDGKSSYSKIVRLVFAQMESNLNIYPHLVVNGLLNLHVNKDCLINMYNSSGTLMFTKQLLTGTQQFDVSNMAKGLYIIQSGKETLKFIIQE